MSERTFIVDCHYCRAKVAAIEEGHASRSGVYEEVGEPFAQVVVVGRCPSCATLLVAESRQLDFAGYDAEDDRWSDYVRVYPKPPRFFLSLRIPPVVRDSLAEADRSLQASANIAACVMLGRALEAICRDVLETSTTASKKKFMLGEGIKKLEEKKIIDERLYDWSQQLQAFRNLAAHPEDISISREDTEDLQTFVSANTEYIYDLADRYNTFKERIEKRKAKKKPGS